MERLNTPNAVQHEIAWRLKGGTPYDVQVVRRVGWDQLEYPHTPLVALINRHDPTHTHYFRSPEEVEGFLTTMMDAMAQAWPDAAAQEPGLFRSMSDRDELR